MMRSEKAKCIQRLYKSIKMCSTYPHISLYEAEEEKLGVVERNNNKKIIPISRILGTCFLFIYFFSCKITGGKALKG